MRNSIATFDLLQHELVMLPHLPTSTLHRHANTSKHSSIGSHPWDSTRKYLNLIRRIERESVRLVEQNRPRALRDYDQIPMRSNDLLKQVKRMMPYLADQSVVFMGDHDSTSLLFGLLGTLSYSHPRQMTIIDFDERLLHVADTFAARHGFRHLLNLQLYNAFDPLPADLIGKHDWFYTNPPYGCRNNARSAHLFITRGCEAVKLVGSKGCIILPDDHERSWTEAGMLHTQNLLVNSGWKVSEKFNQAHRYHLDDDSELTSSVMIVEQVQTDMDVKPLPYAGRGVAFEELPHFYGQSIVPPYPRYIRRDETLDTNWSINAA